MFDSSILIAIKEALRDERGEKIFDKAPEQEIIRLHILLSKSYRELSAHKMRRMTKQKDGIPEQEIQDETLKYARLAFRYHPCSQSCMTLAYAHLDADEKEKAIEWANTAVLGYAEDIQAVGFAHYFFRKLSKPNEAVTAILVGLDKDPSCAAAYYGGYPKNPSEPKPTESEIRERLQELTKKEPDNFLHWTVLGRYEEVLGNNEEALLHYAQARKLKPDEVRPVSSMLASLQRLILLLLPNFCTSMQENLPTDHRDWNCT